MPRLATACPVVPRRVHRMREIHPVLWGLLFLAGETACSNSPATGVGPDARAGMDASTTPADDGGPTPTVGLTIAPETVNLQTDGVSGAAQSFTVTAALQDGSRRDVSDRVRFSLSSSLGSMRGAEFVSAPHGGQATLTASFDGFFATAQITVTLSRVVIGPPPGGANPVPNNPTAIFDNAPTDPNRAPTLIYPNDGVLLPPNLGSLEIHYRPPAQNTLFEIAFSSATAQVRIFTRCIPLSDGCVYTVDPDSWRALADTHRGRSGVQLTVRGTDDAGTAVGNSAQFEANFAFRDVVGGLYYWTTSSGTGIMRVEFGSGETPERFFPFSGGGCFGCHALSRDGQRMSLSMNGINNGQVSLIDVGNRTVLAGPNDNFREQFQSWGPDSRRFVGIYGDGASPDTHLRIRDGDNGQILETIPLGFEPSHPDWSSDGRRIAFTQVTRHSSSQRPGRGGIAYVEQLAAGGWSGPMTLVAPEDGFNRYYPAYAPGGEFLVFNESICPPGQIYTGACDADADEVAKLWAISSAGGQPIRLERANAPGVADGGATDLSNTFPKWAPFIDQRTPEGGRLMWFTFSSRRQYGLRSPGGANNRLNQLLWMVAVNPDAILRGEDGSFAPFALPFQDLTTSNHIAQWTTRVVPGPPTDAGPDAGNDGGVCLEIGSVCDPNADPCCPGLVCAANGPAQFVCRPDI